MANKCEDDYWFASEKKAFSFEDECSLDSMITKSDQKPSSIKGENFTDVENEFIGFQRSVVPIMSVMSSQCLERLLDYDASTQKKHKSPDLAITQAIDNILLNRPYSLEGFKSLESKTKLLDAAIDNVDGNAILTVVLFLSNTLKKNIFFNLLSTRKTAFLQYMNYLALRFNIAELSDLLMIKGYSTVIAIKLFKITINNFINCPNDILHKKIQSLYNNHFSINVNEKDNEIVKKYMDLLEWQINAGKEGSEIKSITGEPVIKSLAVCCKHYWNKPIDSICNPQELSKLQGISERQLHWVFLEVKTEENSWEEILKLLIKNNWFRNKKVINSSLNSENIIILLGEKNAPSSVLETFLSLMEDVDKSVSLAMKFKCHRHIINYYITQKDRLALLNYKQKVPAQSNEYFYIENALSSVIISNCLNFCVNLLNDFRTINGRTRVQRLFYHILPI